MTNNNLDYTGLYYKMFGNRLKKLHGNLSSKDFADELKVHPNVISNIINQNVYPETNPYLISKNHLFSFSEYFNMSPKVFAWGDNEDRERLVAIILLGILFNGSKKNPFIPFDEDTPAETLFKWAKDQYAILPPEFLYKIEKVLDLLKMIPKFDQSEPLNFDYQKESIQDIKINILELFREKLGMFMSKENHELYEAIKTNRDSQLTSLSGLLTNQLMIHYRFATNLIEKLDLWLNEVEKQKDINYYPDELLTEFMSNTYIFDDYDSADYRFFVEAFYKFWRNNKHIYMEFFNETFFENDKKLANGFRDYQNQDFDNVIKSAKFEMLNRKTLIKSRSSNRELALSELYFKAQVCLASERAKKRANPKEYKHDYYEALEQISNKIDNAFDTINPLAGGEDDEH